jgi:DNA-binding FrmR family transcriptional regulator
MAHTIRNKKQLLIRARRLRGQAEAIERALTEERDCGEVLQQLAAVRGAANALMATVLEGHVKEHLRGLGSRDAKMLLSIVRSYLK